jgi:hypothetical protein
VVPGGLVPVAGFGSACPRRIIVAHRGAHPALAAPTSPDIAHASVWRGLCLLLDHEGVRAMHILSTTDNSQLVSHPGRPVNAPKPEQQGDDRVQRFQSRVDMMRARAARAAQAGSAEQSAPSDAIKEAMLARRRHRQSMMADPATPQRPIHRPNFDALGKTDTVAGPPDSAPSEAPLTLDGLMKSWGQTDSPYDLNGDNTVDVQDLVSFLNTWPEGTNAPTDFPEDPTPVTPLDEQVAAPEGPAQPDTPATMTLEGLMAAWGEANSMYDLNAGDTVDVQDLIQFIGQQGAAPAEQPYISPAPAQPSLTTAPVEPSLATAVNQISQAPDQPAAPEVAPMTLDGLMAAWGQADKTYDLNGDMTVDVQDLIQFLTQGEGGASATQAVADANANPTEKLDMIANSLLEKMTGAGYTDAPASNLMDMLESFGLDNGGMKYVFNQLAGNYPKGAMLNLVG